MNGEHEERESQSLFYRFLDTRLGCLVMLPILLTYGAILYVGNRIYNRVTGYSYRRNVDNQNQYAN